MKSNNRWKPDLYDEKIGYVSQYGKGIFDLLQAQQGERILDIGCGTGDLTKEIANSGATPIGIDASPEMIEAAKEKYPELTFIEADATAFHSSEKFHAVFSNAALHWIKEADKVINSVKDVLLPGGRFVAEFGGKDNIHKVLAALDHALKEGISVSNRTPWYFPSIGQYTSLLEKHGFYVIFAEHFDRPTVLGDGDWGLNHWLDSFADDFFPELSSLERDEVYIDIKKQLAPDLFVNGSWVLDYKRLRVIARKESY